MCERIQSFLLKKTNTHCMYNILLIIIKEQCIQFIKRIGTLTSYSLINIHMYNIWKHCIYISLFLILDCHLLQGLRGRRTIILFYRRYSYF